MSDSEASQPEFDNPPVTEVVCGLHFASLKKLSAAHLGAYWEKIKPAYPNCQELAPLAPVVELFQPPRSLELEFSDIPPLPRTWFIHEREHGIVQVQRDRFHHNWKKVRPDDPYPRYGSVVKMFRDRLKEFEAFLADISAGPIDARQYEITYVNHIPQGDGWNTTNDIGAVFPDFVRATQDRFLPACETVKLTNSFVLPEQSGRLHTTIRNTARQVDDKPLLLFELTARGMPPDKSKESMWEWFDQSHDWIVRAFADMTSAKVRKNVWRQTA